MFLNRHNLDIAKLASKEESRYVLGAILANETDTIVTDGHCLVIVSKPPVPESAPVVEGFERVDTPRLIPRQCALDLAKLAKGADFNVVQLGKNGNGAKPAAAIDNSIVYFDPIDGQFPNYKAVMPNHRDAVFTINLDPQLLGKVLDVVNSAIGKEKRLAREVTFRFYDKDKAIRIDATNVDAGQQITAVVMPMTNQYHGAPYWHTRDFHPPQPEAPAAEPETETKEG